jgi:hypothetical protein
MKQLPFVFWLAILAWLQPIDVIAAPGDPQVEVYISCYRGAGIIEVAWKPLPGAATQYVDLSYFDNAFQPGTFQEAGPYHPEQNSVVWAGLLTNRKHYLRMAWIFPNGQWSATRGTTFATPSCLSGPLPIEHDTRRPSDDDASDSASVHLGSYDPPDDFCDLASCVPNFDTGRGYVVQCADGQYSKTGGLSGSCSNHGGNARTSPPAKGSSSTSSASSGNCDRESYPTVCIARYPPDLDCDEIPFKAFKVMPPDPHGFDRDGDGVGCDNEPSD